MTDKKSKYIGISGALLVHAAVMALLILIHFRVPQPEEESGVVVMAGNTNKAYGGFDPKTLVDVEVLPKEENTREFQKAAKQELLTQTEEEAPVLAPAKEKHKEPREKTETEKAEEARKLAEKKEQERKAVAEAAAKRVAGAFGKGAQIEDKGTSLGKGTEGSKTGDSQEGSVSNAGSGYGDFELKGRSIGKEGLPHPRYNIQEEGKVVITITVNPAGTVIGTNINRQTNTVNPVLRKAAEEAAKKARFNEVSGITNQTGTITYYFNLK